jgi:hypothetical protein
VPSVRLEPLPATHENACRLVAELARTPGH